MEAENKELVAQEEDTAEERDDIANSLSESMAESQTLREKIGQLEEQLSEAKDNPCTKGGARCDSQSY